MQQVIFSQEQARFDVATGALTVGLGMVGPTLMTWGRPAQQDRHLEPMLRGEEMWCQLFSEPAAGSDLPALITRAERDGDDFVVDGQKVWTTMAQYSDWAILLARTDRSVPGRGGLSYLLVDMATPGIDVRPLRQITGVAHFNEVFLTDVRVPAANLVGAEGEGWNVARTTLAAERMAIGAGGGTSFGDVAALCREVGGVTRPGPAPGGGPGVHRVRAPALPGLPGPDGAVPGPRPRRRGLPPQAGLLPPERPPGRPRPGTARAIGHRDRWAGLGSRLLAGSVPRPVVHAHRWGHRRDPAQPDRRTGPRPAPRAVSSNTISNMTSTAAPGRNCGGTRSTPRSRPIPIPSGGGCATRLPCTATSSTTSGR